MDPLGGITEQTFDALGRLETRTLPNGVVSTWTYDARGWTDTIVREPAADGGEVLASVDYTRSPSGEPTRIDREDGSYVLYDYDDSLRLTGEHHRDVGGGIVSNIRYVYDADGNRTQRITQLGAGASSTVEDYTYSAGDLLETVSVAGTTTTDYDYDAAGRVVAIDDGSPETLGWDADDHVTSLTEGPRTTHWTFDGDGRRLSRTEEVSGLVDREVGYAMLPTLSESLESPHAVTDSSGNETVDYVFAGEHPLFRFDPNTGEPVYYLQDGMGSVIGLVGDDAGTEVSTIHYDAFGNELRTTGTLATLPAASAGDFRFQGMWLDEGGLYYVRARVYEAGTGRFLSRDPAEGSRTGPETYWAYAFAGSAPTRASDPTGRWTLVEVSALIGIAGVLTATAIAVGPAHNLGLRLPGLRMPSATGLGTRIHAAVAATLLTIEIIREAARQINLRDYHHLPDGCVLALAIAGPPSQDFYRDVVETRHGAVYVCSGTFEHFEFGPITSFSLWGGIMNELPPTGFASQTAMSQYPHWVVGPVAFN